MPNRDAAVKFLDALFPEIPDDGAILVWHLKGRRSSWTVDVAAAADAAVESGGDVYVGACLGPRTILEDPRPEKKRAKAASVLHMPGVWLDVDFSDGGAHKKGNLPPDADAARELIGRMPLSPTIVVHSGHGLQAWWLFQELFELHDPDGRDEAASVAAGWNQLLRKHSGESGWDADSVFDLARVMRIPGTQNCKNGKRIDVVTIEHDSGRRYRLDDLSEYIPLAARQIPISVARAVDSTEKPGRRISDAVNLSFTVNADANPPFDRFEAAQQNLDKFSDTWQRRRKDLQDQSMTGYEMALANFGTLGGWTDQEIVDLLIAFRRKHNAPPKLRPDYFLLTLTKARRLIEATRAEERIDELAALAQTAAEQGEPIGQSEQAAEFRRQALASLSHTIGAEVTAIERTRAEEPIFILRTVAGAATVGTIAAIYSQNTFRQRVSVATGLVPKRRRKNWDSVIQVVLNAATEIDVGPDATAEGTAICWVQSYLADHPPLDLDRSPEERPRPEYPVVRTLLGARVLIVDGRHLRGWLRVAPGYNEKVSSQRLGMLLRTIGGRSKAVRHLDLARPVRRWVLPERVMEVEEPEPEAEEPKGGNGVTHPGESLAAVTFPDGAAALHGAKPAEGSVLN